MIFRFLARGHNSNTARPAPNADVELPSKGHAGKGRVGKRLLCAHQMAALAWPPILAEILVRRKHDCPS
jgi:hypothetical protein